MIGVRAEALANSVLQKYKRKSILKKIGPLSQNLLNGVCNNLKEITWEQEVQQRNI